MSMSTSRTPDRLTDEQRIFFDTQGYLIVEDALEGDQLTRVQEACYRVEEETQEEWKRAIAEPPDFKPYGLGPTAHVVEPIVTHDDVFLDVLEHPKTIPIAEAFIGPDILMIDNALHVKPAATKSHTRWHRDATTWFYSPEAWDEADWKTWEQIRASEAPFSKIKIFFFVEDIEEDTSPFSVVPESHKLDVDTVPQYDDLTDMPNYIKLVGKAGTAVLWNGYIWHAAMDNVGTKDRRMLLYNYVHFGMKQYDLCVPTEAFAAHVQNRSPICRQLLGLERMSRA
jgi:ectoine hydroxylase-related dioxygenase (phytanoyl-CoA dioxygenase family)